MSAFIGTRPAIFFVGYLAVIVIGYAPGVGPRPGEPPYRDYDNELLNLPNRWDAGWYLQIANPNWGYTYDDRGGAGVQQNIVFWPAYPLTVRVAALLLGNSKGSFLLAGTLVSLIAFLCGLVYLYALARDHLSEEQSSIALWLFAAYPFAFFYGAVYTESLFLLSAAGAFYHLKHREPWRAGLWGLVAGLTRANGCLLCVPLALVAISPWLPAGIVRAHASTANDRLEGRSAALIPKLAVAAMPCVGTLIYSAFVWTLTGNPLSWVAGHAAWGRQYTGLTSLVTDRYTFIANAGRLRLCLTTAPRSAERDGSDLRAGGRVAGRPPVRHGLRRVHADQHPGADCGWRTAVGGAVLVGALSGILLDGERGAAKPPVRLDRHLRGQPSLERVPFLYLAAVVLIPRSGFRSRAFGSDGCDRLGTFRGVVSLSSTARGILRDCSTQSR